MAYYLIAFFTLGPAFMTFKAVQLWRNAELVGFFMNTFAFLPFGKDVRRGEVRSLNLTVASLWAADVLLLVGLTGGELSGFRAGAVVAAVLVILACVCGEVCVVLFNAPKFVVPPHMRTDPGVLAARRARRHSARR
ncbi:hypothetical protein ACL02O_33190 [Micromonospora sp. MS34]|uniref:hypothetical protein n=1 Tax=Micromonospora sp. MS34 TaxID=3385971 RepID=UPI0039A2479F